MSVSAQPVFVVGIWRSGTSFLYALLNQHSDISLMYESDLLLLSPMFAGGKAKADWKQRWDFWNAGLSRHELDPARLPDQVPNVEAAMRAVCQEYAGSAIWGCKSPSYYDRLDVLSRLFPDARFIIIWRNPADTCRSIVRASKKTSFFGKTGMAKRALLGNREMKKGCDLLLSRGCQVHQLQYEELISEPVAHMEAICEFLRIPFDPKMATLQGADRSAIFSHEHHKSVKGEKIVSQAPRPEVLPPALKSKIDRYLAYWKEQYGGQWPAYPPLPESFVKPSFLERACDLASFRTLQAWDRAVAVAYCFLPIALLRGYRSLKRQNQPMPSKKEDALQSAQPD
jgi:hypothetical protein